MAGLLFTWLNLWQVEVLAIAWLHCEVLDVVSYVSLPQGFHISGKDQGTPFFEGPFKFREF